MGKAREQELRLTAFGLIALLAVAALMTVLMAAAFRGHLNVTILGTTAGQDVGGASAPYVQR
jgi:hypothetical protein